MAPTTPSLHRSPTYSAQKKRKQIILCVMALRRSLFNSRLRPKAIDADKVTFFPLWVKVLSTSTHRGKMHHTEEVGVYPPPPPPTEGSSLVFYYLGGFLAYLHTIISLCVNKSKYSNLIKEKKGNLGCSQ